MIRLFLVLCLFLAAVCAAAQGPATLTVTVVHDGKPVPEAEIHLGGAVHRTGPDGTATFPQPADGSEMAVSADGFEPKAVPVPAAAASQEITVGLEQRHEEEIVVSATRTGERLDDQPTRVEVLEREEIEEKILMTPGDIVMMLNEMGGLRVQATSPSLGAASVRIQGMRGRYTRFLSDGLPLFGQVGGLGLLQIPPMDLGQVEVIKGTASAMYGSGAMGGVVNLVSRRPGAEPIREALLNRSSRGGTDSILFMAQPVSAQWSASLLAGGHFHSRNDIDDDGWADMPGYKRGVLRPRAFWDNGAGKSVFLTAGLIYEDRLGGTVDDGTLPGGMSYRESLLTRHFDVGTVVNAVAGEYLLSLRFAAARQAHDHGFGEVRERDTHDTLFSEISARRVFGRHTVVAGAAFERDAFRPTDVPQFRFTHTVPGVFLQDDFALTPWLSFSASARVDSHSEYGTFFSPRVSALAKGEKWTGRVAVGQGFFAPTPMTEETEAAGLTRLTIADDLRAERGRSASIDLTRTAGPVSVTATLFGSMVRNPISVERESYTLRNLGEATRNLGGELLGTWRAEPFSLTASYTYVRSRENSGSGREDVALTPRHSAGFVGMWESEEKGRVGVELYYTGEQRLEVNPYRDRSRPYWIAGALVERKFGPARLFFNAENLTGVRQTRWDRLLRPNRAADGRWTVDAWAPLEGRNFNGGVRFEF